MRRTTIVLAGCGVLGLALLLAGCGGGGGKATTAPIAQTSKEHGCTIIPTAPKPGARTEAKPTQALAVGSTYDVTMTTNCGSFTIRIDQAQSPHSAASFVSLVKLGFFDATIFHRIVPGFVIQGGDPTATGAGGPGYTTIDKPPSAAAYTHGVVAMAKTASQPAGTSGSQFFIVTVANANLPADYAIIGKVTRGLAVVDRIGKLGDANQQPTMVVEIEHASVKVS